MKEMCYIYSAKKGSLEIGSGNGASSNVYLDDIAVHYCPQGVHGIRFSHSGGAGEVINSPYKDAFRAYINNRIKSGTMKVKKCKECGVYFIVADEQISRIRRAASACGTDYREPERCELCRTGYNSLIATIDTGCEFEDLIRSGKKPPVENENGECFYAMNYSPKNGFFYEPYTNYLSDRENWGLTSFIFVGLRKQIEVVCNFYNRMRVTHQARVQKCVICGRYFTLTKHREHKLRNRGATPSALCRDCGLKKYKTKR